MGVDKKSQGGESIKPRITEEQLRNMSRYLSRWNKVDLPTDMLVLVKTYAEQTCDERGTCAKLGMISCCAHCFVDRVLVPDMIARSGGNYIVSWVAKEPPGTSDKKKGTGSK